MNVRLRRVAFALIAVVLSGCAQYVQLPAEISSKLRREGVSLRVYQHAEVSIQTPGDVIGGWVWKQIWDVDGGPPLVDVPTAEVVALALQKSLGEVGIPLSGSMAIRPQSELEQPFVSTSGEKPYVMRINVFMNVFSYLPTQWNTFRHVLAADVMIFDSGTRTLVWHQRCVIAEVPPDLHFHRSDFHTMKGRELYARQIQSNASSCAAMMLSKGPL